MGELHRTKFRDCYREATSGLSNSSSAITTWKKREHYLCSTTRPLSQRPINHEEALKRDAWRRYRSWSRITSGVVRSILGQARWRLQFWPARAGHHLHPIAGFWRVLQGNLGAGRCFPDLQQLYWRVRRVLTAHHEQPTYACRW
jgi:hypothetical protein